MESIIGMEENIASLAEENIAMEFHILQHLISDWWISLFNSLRYKISQFLVTKVIVLGLSDQWSEKLTQMLVANKNRPLPC